MSPYKLQPVVDLPLPPGSLEGEAVPGTEAAQDEVLELFDECAPRLRRYVSSFGLKAEVTQDIVQEVFLSLFRHLLLGRSRSNLRGWIFQVGHNLALKQRHRASRTQRTEGTWDATLTDSLVDPAENPEERLAVTRTSGAFARRPSRAARTRPALPLSSGRGFALSRDREGARHLARVRRQVVDARDRTPDER